MGLKVINIAVIFSCFCAICITSDQLLDCEEVFKSNIPCNGKNKIKVVRLKENITKLDEDVFKDMRNVKRIDLKNNSISDLNSKIFQEVPLVNDINLNYNKLRTIKEETFGNITELRLLHIANNCLETIGNNAFIFPRLQILVLEYNKIHSISKDAFRVNSTIHTLRFRNNQVSNVSFISNLYNLSKLDCTSNSIKDIDENTFEMVSKLTQFECMNNHIENLNFLKHLKNLTHLDLTNNSITDLSVTTFLNLRELDTILLTKNKLQVIRTGVFAELTKLKVIALADNNIHKIGEIFEKLPKLSILNVRNNQLQSLPNGVTETSINITLRIDGNNWTCRFIRTIADKSSIKIDYTPQNNVTNYKNISCFDEIVIVETKQDEDITFYQYIIGSSIFVAVCLGCCGSIYLAFLFIIRCRALNNTVEIPISYSGRNQYDCNGYLEPRQNFQEEGIYEEIADDYCTMGNENYNYTSSRRNEYIFR